ncbi:hypothetical protein DVA67_031845 [Solirubrobacter sp. CPCC 204708]|uniref:Uncharacterized protein n=1 Tax=Solirubrobacter deserti TaxID=2282478 RepID=A0ABT4RQ20_9ACTN|nr:hypothetical protein [Solirubrobacter deserti]MBE2320596.1 hypothetical protein [Solirubrobacter deserti]MDA0140651.1 hypothetical protein [Solirubrobacter deserti]
MTHFFRILVAALAAALLTAPVASAQSAFAPTLSAPSNGKSLARGKAFTFKAKLDSASSASGVFVRVAKSKKVDAEGLISDDLYMRSMTLRGGTYQHKTERYPALSSHFLNKPGKYYWQAYAIDCSDGTDDCNIESEIRSFRIK